MGNYLTVKTTNQYIASLPFFKRILFRVKWWIFPSSSWVDYGSNDSCYIIVTKRIDGIVFIIDEIKFTLPDLIQNKVKPKATDRSE